jgi:argininosuccinate lyase
MSGIARTSATGAAMLPELVRLTSSLESDLVFLREDLLGSAAHAVMLGRAAIISVHDARILRDALLEMERHARGPARPELPLEEDVHMAVEAALAAHDVARVAAPRLHTARSRNDQVALDLRLFVRDRGREVLARTSKLAMDVLARGERDGHVLMPAYTHRQRAQPITAAFLACAWASALLRAGDVLAFALDAADRSPLGSGACSGTSLPIDRALTARLLGFSRTTTNALDAVHDRDFALDFVWACARVNFACAQIAADVIDFSTSEFRLVTLDGEIAAGSSMMPQKKNPDVFELARGKASGAAGDVAAMLALVRGLPSGYNRDQQEDRAPIQDAPARARDALELLTLSLPHVHFDAARGREMLDEGFTQATDLAEALVAKGLPFREAYGAVGALVRRALDANVTLRAVGVDVAKSVHSAIDEDVLAVLDPARAAAAKESPGGTGAQSVAAQIVELRARADALAAHAGKLPTLDSIAHAIANEPL